MTPYLFSTHNPIYTFITHVLAGQPELETKDCQPHKNDFNHCVITAFLETGHLNFTPADWTEAENVNFVLHNYFTWT